MDQKPSIGRIVHFQFSAKNTGDGHGGPYAAVVTHVNRDGRVELEVFGNTTFRFQYGLRHRQDPARRYEDDFWEWPPRVP